MAMRGRTFNAAFAPSALTRSALFEQAAGICDVGDDNQ
jgi:hypothetical protein